MVEFPSLKRTEVVTLFLVSRTSVRIDTAWAAGLGEFLSANATLRHLSLSKSNLGEDGAAQLLIGFSSSTSLSHLNLSSNHIGGHGLVKLCKVLATNSTLTSLFLIDNNIQDIEAARLLTSISSNNHLTTLSLVKNIIQSEFYHALSTNSTLTDLDIRDTPTRHDPALVSELLSIVPLHASLNRCELHFLSILNQFKR